MRSHMHVECVLPFPRQSVGGRQQKLATSAKNCRLIKITQSVITTSPAFLL